MWQEAWRQRWKPESCQTRPTESYYNTHLQHLDKRHTQVHVGNVAEYQAQAEHDADWHDSLPGDIIISTERVEF